MPHDVALITTIAAGLGLALILGFLAARLKLPAIVGYLLAGVVIGPATPGFVADLEMSRQLAEIGVILLMFGVGLHLSLDDLLEVRRIALPGAIAQIAAATAFGAAVAFFWGWSLGAGIVFGLALSVASTVALLRALEDRGVLDSVNGRIAVGWLVVEDLAMVLTLVLLPPLARWLGGDARGLSIQAGGESVLVALALTLGKVAVFAAIMLLAGRRVLPWLLAQVARTGSRELFTLCIIASAVGIAYGSAELFGVSFALGAFFAGVIMHESDLSQRAARESLPLRDAFAVLFFVSVGMLFDPAILIRQPLQVLAVLAIIVFGKSLAAFFLVLAFRYPLNTALTVSASLAQIGEFSSVEQSSPNAWPMLTQVVLGVVDGHPIDARTAPVASDAFPRSFEILSIAHLLHQLLRHGRTFGCWLRHERFGPLAAAERSFTPAHRFQGQRVLVLLPLSAHELPVLLATANRSGLRPSFPARPIRCSTFRPWSASLALPTAWPTMPSADSCIAVRPPCGCLSSEIGTRRRPPQVSSIAFSAPLPDLQPWPLMDRDFAVSRPLVRPGMPHIRFLFVRSRFCSALPSDTTSR